jgi:hypothetical protein
LASQAPEEQKSPVEQSVAERQGGAQAAPRHARDWQPCAVASVQPPWPSQLEAGMRVPPSQPAGGPQVAVAPGYTHAPVLSQAVAAQLASMFAQAFAQQAPPKQRPVPQTSAARCPGPSAQAAPATSLVTQVPAEQYSVGAHPEQVLEPVVPPVPLVLLQARPSVSSKGKSNATPIHRVMAVSIPHGEQGGKS